jgi:hypothetical protein
MGQQPSRIESDNKGSYGIPGIPAALTPASDGLRIASEMPCLIKFSEPLSAKSNQNHTVPPPIQRLSHLAVHSSSSPTSAGNKHEPHPAPHKPQIKDPPSSSSPPHPLHTPSLPTSSTYSVKSRPPISALTAACENKLAPPTSIRPQYVPRAHSRGMRREEI